MNSFKPAALNILSAIFLLPVATLAQAQADLSLTEIGVNNNIVYAAGDPIAIDTEITNVGGAASPAYTVDYYVSTDAQITTGDNFLGSSSRPALGQGNDDNFTANVNLPVNLTAGNYFIGGIINIDDANNGNNTNLEDEPISVQGGGGGGNGAMLNPGHNGNWWAGASRNGEGVQVEVSNNNTGGRVLVATMYSYDPTGQPIFLLAVGQVINGEAVVDVYIYEGPSWGAGYDPADWVETQWGTGLFTASSCGLISMTLTPNANFAAQGYTAISYDMTRLTNSAIPCPLP
jgi:hypothetical protein